MAHASKKKFGPGTHGKGTGHGAMFEADTESIPANMVLSNRDKAQHSDERGLDSKMVQTMQYRDHAANRRVDDEELPDLGGVPEAGDDDR